MKILDVQLDELRDRLVKRGIDVQLTSGAKQYLLQHGYDAQNGVRPMRRLIQDTLEDQIAVGLLEDRYNRGHIIRVGSKADDLTYDVESEAKMLH